MNKDFCVYRYILRDTHDIVYVGKTNSSLKARIDAHEKEEKFQYFKGRWRIEYISLANAVETDIVEKYFINKWKPILNEKDNVPEYTDLTFLLPEWEPYEAYLFKNHFFIEKEKWDRAVLDEEFLRMILDAEQSKQTTFITPFLHPTGMLPIREKNKYQQVTKKEVSVVPNGYLQELIPASEFCDNTYEEQYFKILYFIWSDIYEQIFLYAEDKEKIDNIKQKLSFCQELETFAINGYEQDLGLGKMVFRAPNNNITKDACFCGIYSISFESENYLYLDTNYDYLSKLQKIREKLYQEIYQIYHVYTGLNLQCTLV